MCCMDPFIPIMCLFIYFLNIYFDVWIVVVPLSKKKKNLDFVVYIVHCINYVTTYHALIYLFP
jgi:hypothetical protein